MDLTPLLVLAVLVLMGLRVRVAIPPVPPAKGAQVAIPPPMELPVIAASLTMASMRPPLPVLPARMVLLVLEEMPLAVLVRPAVAHVTVLPIPAVQAACLIMDTRTIPALLAPITKVVWEET